METTRRFTTKDLILTIATILILVVATLLFIKPVDRMNQQKDTSRQTDVSAITKAIKLYMDDNGKAPALAGGRQITPTESDASDLVDITPTYLNFIPHDPDGGEYKLLLTTEGSIEVTTKLSDGDIFSQNTNTLD